MVRATCPSQERMASSVRSSSISSSRDVIAQGAERLGWELDMLLERTLEAISSCEGQVARTMEQL